MRVRVASPIASSARLQMLAVACAMAALLFVALYPGAVSTIAVMVVVVLIAVAIATPATVEIDEEITVRWLGLRRAIARADVTSVARRPDGAELLLADGRRVFIGTHTAGREGGRSSVRGDDEARELLIERLSSATGKPATGAVVVDEEDFVAPPVVLEAPGPDEVLQGVLLDAEIVARDAGEKTVSVGIVVDMLLQTPSLLPLLRMAGMPEEVDVTFARPHASFGEGYRARRALTLPHDAVVERALRRAHILAQHGNAGIVRAEAVVAELAQHLPIDGRLVFLDAWCHDFPSTLSRALTNGTATGADVAPEGASNVRLVLVNDDYSTFDLVIDVLVQELAFPQEQAREIAQRVHEEGRAELSVHPRDEGVRLALAAMQRARLEAQPLRIVIERVT